MKTTQFAPVFGLVAAAQAWGSNWNASEPIVWTTVTTDIYTTFCPESTTFTQGTKTYTATASETLTITDCPCTFSHPATSLPSAPASSVTSFPTAPATSVTSSPAESTTSVTPKPSTYVPAPNGTWVPPVWITTTETVKTYTTFCPSATSVVQGNQTYTVTGATTLTVTNCPCTQTNTYPGTTTTIVVGTTTTYCPSATTITTGGTTIAVSTPGTVTVPVCSTTVVPITTPIETAPGQTYTATPAVPETTSASSIPGVSQTTSYVASGSLITTKVGPSPTSSGPVLVTANAAVSNQAGVGALAVAGLMALVL